jgi:PPP family 3-phenylpropionic acid transporter
VPSWRLALLYAASYLALGALVPYLALELQGAGVWGTALLLCMAALPLGRLVAGPAWGMAADALRAPGRVLRIAAWLAPLPVVGMLLALHHEHRGGVLLACVVYAALVAPIGPMIDALVLGALDRSAASPAAYGRLRRWGSLGYLLGSLTGGVARQHLGLSPLYLVLLGTLLLAFASLGVPDEGRPASQPLLPAVRRLLQDRAMAGLLLAGALHFSVHVGAAALLSLHMVQAGLGTDWTGVALATGVVVEILLMSAGQPLLARFGPRPLLLAALSLALLRWVGMSMVSTGPAMVALQASHGITFGAFWIASVALVERGAPPEIRASSQALLAAAVAGAGALLGMAGGSWVAETFDTWTFFRVGAGTAFLATLVAAATVREHRP